MELKKNKKYELEPKRPMFFGIGMIIALSLTIVAFEWKSPVEAVVVITPAEDIPWYVLDEPKVTKQNIPDIPKPKPEKQVISAISEIKGVEEITKELSDEPIIDSDEIDAVIDFGEPVEPEISDEPFIVVEDMPEFPGGEQALLSFIAKNIKYPKAAQRMGIEGRVSLKFIIDVDGSKSNVEVVRGIGAGCDEEAIRVVKMLPKFSPGKQRGIPVKVQMQLPVNFKLQ